MPITYSEKTMFHKKSATIANQLLHLDEDDFENTVLLFKVLAYSLRNNEALLEDFDESIFENKNVLKEKFNILLQHALQVATTPVAASAEHPPISTEAIPKEYSPSQLGKFFGVSVTTIHNWIKQGRFVGVAIAGDNKHNRISGNTAFITAAGEHLLVRDVVEMWHKQEAETDTLEHGESKLEHYTRLIAEYEQKYGGEFERTLGAKKTLTPEESTDAEIWLHLLGRQTIEFRDAEK